MRLSARPNIVPSYVGRKMRIDAHIHFMPPALAESLSAFAEQEPYWGLLLAGAETEQRLRARGFRSRIHKRGRRHRPLTEAETEANYKKSKVRARIEHVFGAQENAPGGRLVRTIGIVRAQIKIGLQNLAYNIRRLVFLERLATT